MCIRDSYTGDEEFNYYLAVLFPDEQLYIMDYNRVVKDLNGLTKEQFLEKLEQNFTVEPYLGEGPCSPPQKHCLLYTSCRRSIKCARPVWGQLLTVMLFFNEWLGLLFETVVNALPAMLNCWRNKK